MCNDKETEFFFFLAGEKRVMKTVTTMAAAVNVYDLYNSLVFSPDERSVPSSM